MQTDRVTLEERTVVRKDCIVKSVKREKFWGNHNNIVGEIIGSKDVIVNGDNDHNVCEGTMSTFRGREWLQFE